MSNDYKIIRSDDYAERLTKTHNAMIHLARRGQKVTFVGIKAMTGGSIPDVKGRFERLIELGFIENENAGTHYAHMAVSILKDEKGKPFDVTYEPPKAEFKPYSKPAHPPLFTPYTTR